MSRMCFRWVFAGPDPALKSTQGIEISRRDVAESWVLVPVMMTAADQSAASAPSSAAVNIPGSPLTTRSRLSSPVRVRCHAFRSSLCQLPARRRLSIGTTLPQCASRLFVNVLSASESLVPFLCFLLDSCGYKSCLPRPLRCHGGCYRARSAKPCHYRRHGNKVGSYPAESENILSETVISSITGEISSQTAISC